MDEHKEVNSMKSTENSSDLFKVIEVDGGGSDLGVEYSTSPQDASMRTLKTSRLLWARFVSCENCVINMFIQ